MEQFKASDEDWLVIELNAKEKFGVAFAGLCDLRDRVAALEAALDRVLVRSQTGEYLRAGTPDPTPTPLPAAPDWRALCQELIQAINEDVIDANDWQRFEAVVNRVRADIALATRAALSTPPAPPLEPRGCPTPGACSCPTAPIVPPELIRALELAEAALSDIGDADREPGDDIAWAERRAAQDMPRIRHALRTWRDHATPPAATREAEHDDGDDAIDRWVDSKSDWISNWGAPRSDIAALIGEALEHWGRSATREAGPLPQAPPTEEDLYDLAEAFNGDPVPAIRRALELWGGAAVPVPVPVSERPWERQGWLDAEGCCWATGGRGDWIYVHAIDRNWSNPTYTHLLPHWALPVPAAAAGDC